MIWTDEMNETLRKLWSDGHSASEIAARIGAVSRNAVLGKVWRMKLPSRPRDACTLMQRANGRRSLAALNRKKGKGKPFVFIQKAPSPPKVDGLPLPMPTADDKARICTVDLEEHHCRWPVGDPKAIPSDAPLFCGLEKRPGSPYCPGHFARAHNLVQVRRPSVPTESNVLPIRAERELQVA